MSSPDGYDVFLSHASADKLAVEALARRLRAAGLKVFLDKWDLVPGTLWQQALEDALAQSRKGRSTPSSTRTSALDAPRSS